MQLQQIIPQWQGAPVNITDLTLDSRKVAPGFLFLAVPGQRHDGREHIEQAIAAGAAAVAYETGDGFTCGAAVPLLAIEHLSAQLSAIAARFYGEPASSLGLIATTGTNGKTSVSQMLAQALNSLNQPCGVIGTLGSGMPGALLDHGMTTPDALAVQQQLARLRDEGAQRVSMEVSSHALDQGRVAALQFEVGIFTNLSRDHLDYHGDMASYGAAKARLLTQSRTAVVNIDDAFGRALAAGSPVPVSTYGVSDNTADLYCSDIRFDAEGIKARLHTPVGMVDLCSPLLGSFNLSNVLAVAGALLALDVPLQRIAALIGELLPPTGRMQRLGGNGQPLVVIDYAHTPDALEKALAALRAHVAGRLICVFGCGGDRDRGKRPLMGRIAELGADHLVLTDDNPRTEASAAIISEISAGIEHPQRAAVIANRAEAIGQTIASADAGDIILVAGKGHEIYQEIDGVRHPFSDIEQAERALKYREEHHA
ncbi:UDP-N-acetylmuramoylalanyl-D-glutamate--2,6-diaminopimelate ligase [Halopseudomonas litoralis]|uniref:UDP-N-acetylmuramoyl-L-alanyl-D-glutamate--2,6-diaminopimelate ligase n=1 Tax=Halopseudomonas litoralis TaxID=797277 RepID=A0A1H1UCW5_9GAMM|nr:UDP-N-acetylmuramoyl-L-alanyl-D-glutamate--2,6-diaminopimelate ligase [Halopseudomonas litoralis]SDS70352.1 UDP-N-acetylmuramoylalanyl-D-glutamate--2,6-diaminopimelate ligase [Halopseudomonas litoralis]